ncbi:MAG: inorganic pyrophosphatase [Anaerolineae bacterium]|nr:inorganic pyrophosphatase [Anaerolineae bacterium]
MGTVAVQGGFGRAFWKRLAALVRTTTIEIDRPRGTHHPRYPTAIYPLDYGYLFGTAGGDGAAVDVWIGSNPSRGITGIVCTIDSDLRDAEIKVLLGCTPDEMRTVLDFHNQGSQSALLLRPEDEEGS